MLTAKVMVCLRMDGCDEQNGSRERRGRSLNSFLFIVTKDN